MAEISFNCSVGQGFNFERDSQEAVGHINSLKIGDQELLSDLAVGDPEAVGGDPVKVFGVASSIFWEGGYADPLQFSCQISTENKKTLATLLHQTLSDTTVTLAFTIYDYDPDEKKYYKCFHTDGAELNCLVLKQGGELAMHLDMDQSQEVVSPKNFAFNLGAMPEDEQQAIHVAVSVSDKFVKQFGITVAG